MAASFSAIREKVFDYARSIVYAPMTTVDGKNHPRLRVLVAVWQVVDGRPVGWLATGGCEE